MKRVVFLALMCTLLLGTAASGDYYATKADERNGILTPGELQTDSNVGSDTCGAGPPPIGPADPFNDTGDTCDNTDTVGTVPMSCNGNYTTVAGEDEIYELTVGAGNSITVTVTTSSGEYDPSIYLVSTCNDGNSCVAGADNCFAANAGGNPCGASSDETFGPTALAPGTYYLYIDSFYASGCGTGGRCCGPFDLTVNGPYPVELMEFSID